MKTKRVDGILFEKMIRNGLFSLRMIEKELNAMNVFPVADGDTGTNLVTTLDNAVSCARTTENLSEYLQALSSGMLLGARGNSGVILSQIFKGISLELFRRPFANAIELRNAFIRGYRVAYESVIHPVEGTILTVAREGIDHTVRQTRNIHDVESLLETYVSYMEVTLQETPDMLPELREAGVLDSGGKGYIAIVQGMLDWLNGREYTEADVPVREKALPQPAQPAAVTDLSLFNEQSSFEKGYCTEFILQLLKYPPYDQRFEEAAFIRDLQAMGESLVVVRDGSRVKVHVHTNKPAEIISFAQRFGEFLTFKLENMQLQHNEYLSARQDEPALPPEPAEPPVLQLPEKQRATLPEVPRIQLPVAVIAAVNGRGNQKIFEDLGCGFVIQCGETMNASASEFLEMIRRADAAHTVILPGNGNLVLAARQAAELSGMDVTVLPSATIPESYFALAMDLPDSRDFKKRLEQMEEGIRNVETLLVTTSARSFEHGGMTINADEWVALYRGEPVAVSDDPADVILRALDRVEGISDRESCVFFRGSRASLQMQEAVEAAISEKRPMLETTFLDGGQSVYYWMIGIV